MQKQFDDVCQEKCNLEEKLNTISQRISDENKDEELKSQQELVQNLHDQLRSVTEEKEDLLAGFNSLKENFMMKEFELNSSVENIQMELAQVVRSLELKEKQLMEEKENSGVLITKLQDAENSKFLKEILLFFFL